MRRPGLLGRVLLLVTLGVDASACGGASSPPSPSPSPSPPTSTSTSTSARVAPTPADTFVDPAATAEDARLVPAAVDAAFAHVSGVLGPLRSPRPAIVLCQSDTCARSFVGTTGLPRALAPGDRAPGASYVAPRDRSAIVVPRFGTRLRNLLAHELVHIELRARLAPGAMPTWFEEGLATSVGDHPPCDGAAAKGIDDLALVATPRAWETYLLEHPDEALATICQARAEVEAWGATRGAAGLGRLLAALERGEPFAAAVGR